MAVDPNTVRGLPIRPWGLVHGVTFSDIAGRNSIEISIQADVCSIRVVDGQAFFKLGDSSVTAAAGFDDSIFIDSVDGWVEVITNSSKYISFVQAAGSVATQAQIAERIIV